jgi:cobalt-zinc-cadmium efflux system membrane fusion protein
VAPERVAHARIESIIVIRKRVFMSAPFFVPTIVLAAALSGLMAGCSEKPAPPPAVQAEPAQPPLKPGQVRVKAASLKYMDIQELSQAGAGRVVWAPARMVFRDEMVSEVASPVAGRLVDVSAKVGDTVKVGTPLASISSPEASRIRGDYQTAVVELRVAEAEARRQQMMTDKGIGIASELFVAQARLQEARHAVDTASRASAYLGNGGSDVIQLRSPRAGVVITRTAVPGASVTSDTGSLFTVGDPTALWITADVFENDLRGVREGATVRVEMPSLDQPVTGKVQRVGSSLNAQTRRATVFVSLDQPNPNLRAGMLARVGITTTAPAGMSVPINAVLIKDGQRSIVFVQVAETTFEARTVTLGQPSNGFIPVLSGLNPGEKVVVKGGLLLDGSANQLL